MRGWYLPCLLLANCLVATEFVGTVVGPPDCDAGACVSERHDVGPDPRDAGACTPRLTSGTWRAMPKPTTSEVSGLWGTSGSNVWAVSSRTTSLYHWNGSSWSDIPTGGVTDDGLMGIWGSAADDLWAVGSNGIIAHWDGNSVSLVPGFTRADHFIRVWGSSASDVWAVGSVGLVAHFDGARWTRQPILDIPNRPQLDDGSLWQTVALTAIWGSSSKDIWAGGFQFIGHFEEGQWSGELASLHSYGGLWGSGPNDVWAVGTSGQYYQGGVISHWDGFRWTHLERADRLHTVWGSARDDVWAVGGGFAPAPVYRFDGCTWNPVPIPGNTAAYFAAVWGSGPDEVWVSGSDGTVYRYSAP